MMSTVSADTKRLNDLRLAVDKACIVAVTDAKGFIVFVNDNFCNISGYSSGEHIGEMYNIFNSSYHPKKVYDEMWQTISRGDSFRTEFKDKNKQGQFFWVDTTIIPFLNEKGKPFQYIAISHDITELKTSERSLVQWKQRYDAATDAAKQIFYDYSIVADQIVWGGSFEKILGYTLKELKNDTNSWLDLIHPDDRQGYQKSYNLALTEKKFFHHEYRVRHKNKSYLFVQEDGRFLFDESEDAERMIGFIVDISERKQLEKITIELPKRIIKAQEQEKERIALDIHDDLGQSLIGTKMLITSYMTEKDFQNPEVQKFGKEVLHQINHCIDKARKVSYGLVPPQLKLLGLSAAVKEMVKHIGENGKIKVTFKQQNAKNLKISGDEINVYRIIQEGLTNILKHANASKTDISMSCTNGQLDVVIKDNGRGFDKKVKRKSKSLARGLGLSVMKERARMLNGKVRVDSKPGAGTTIKINVPLENSENA